MRWWQKGMMPNISGLTNKETAHTLRISEATVERRWAFAKVCLFHMIQAEYDAGGLDRVCEAVAGLTAPLETGIEQLGDIGCPHGSVDNKNHLRRGPPVGGGPACAANPMEPRI